MIASHLRPVALATGFFVSWVAVPISAQDYIDVEAEREAARLQEQGAAEVAQPVPLEDADTSYSVPGIRPYSGDTVTVTPVETPDLAAAAVPTNVGALVVQLQQLQEEVRRLNGLVEEHSEEIQRLREQSLERYVDLDRRLGGINGLPVNAESPAEGETLDPNATDRDPLKGDSGNVAGSQQLPVQPGEEAAYQAGYELVKTRRFSEAVEAFQGFLTDFPFGRYAPNAHYWLGELYLVTEPPEPELARQSFKLLLDQYPDNPKIPDALYKLGRVHYLKGNSGRAREYLDRVVSEYPGHPAAQLAQDFLDESF